MRLTMGQVFTAILAVLLLLSALVDALRPTRVQDGRSELVWVSDDNPARREQISLFNDLNPTYQLRLDPANSGMEKLIVQCIAGVGPDLFDCYDGFQLSAFVRSGIAWDLTDTLGAEGVDVKRDAWQATHTTCLYDGRPYGIPRNAGTDALLFNKALFDASRVPYPERFMRSDTFLNLARKLTVSDAEGRIERYGFLFAWWQYRHFLRQWDAQVYSADGTRCVLDSPEAIAAVQYMHDLVWLHKVSPTPQQEAAMATTGGWGSGTITLFGGGRGAMALAGRWWLCTLRNKENFPDLSMGVSECQFGPVRQYRGYCGVVMINRNSPRREQALDFLRYMAQKPYNDLINHQADALCPIRTFAETDAFLSDPAYPDETYNDVWLEVMKYGLPDEISPFVNGSAANRIITEQLDLIKADLKPVDEGLRTATEQINEEIRKTLERDPSLRQSYKSLLAKEDRS